MTDTLLILVTLLGGPRVTAEAVLLADSALLGGPEATELLGLTPAWSPLAELRRQWPAVMFTWEPWALRLTVDDPGDVLPASRRARDARLRTAAVAVPYLPTRSGPYLVLAADDRQHAAADAGYSWRGRVAIAARRSALGTAWSVGVSPTRTSFISYADGDARGPTVAARASVGPLWASATWLPEARAAELDALLAVGPFHLLASTRDVFLLTFRGSGGTFQVGRSAQRTSVRMSWGPAPASPFSFPAVP